MLRFKASFYLYKSCSTKTRDLYPGLLQFTCLLSFSCLPRVVTRSPAALTVSVVYSSHDQVPLLPCVISISITCCCQPHPPGLSQANAYSARYTGGEWGGGAWAGGWGVGGGGPGGWGWGWGAWE